MGNKLKQRFVASAALAPRRDAARKRLVALWFESGLAERRAHELATSIPTTSALTQEAIDKETDAVVARLRALAVTAAAPVSSAPRVLGSPP
jgi:spore coat protein CotH